ncbi:hypothetical protein NDU88_003409 [Pleurodeles waltl]|uniref:Uncharacterized protein n=1 Tax=Pleurodeles waltl TaxID=8319 RepID=A0AAV7WS99_PLEWA|nr:hypothetical protein NDU88_003409 [Pleurodeles waltl]
MRRSARGSCMHGCHSRSCTRSHVFPVFDDVPQRWWPQVDRKRGTKGRYHSTCKRRPACNSSLALRFLALTKRHESSEIRCTFLDRVLIIRFQYAFSRSESDVSVLKTFRTIEN